MTSKILNNVISSRSEGDIAKLFWTCLFCPSIFLAKFFSSAVQHFFASTESWGAGFGFVFFSFAFQFFFNITWVVLFLFCFVYMCITNLSLISYAELLIKISIWDWASSLEEACSTFDAL